MLWAAPRFVLLGGLLMAGLSSAFARSRRLGVVREAVRRRGENRKQYAAAIADYDQVTRLEPANTPAWNSLYWTEQSSANCNRRCRIATKRCCCAPTSYTRLIAALSFI